MYLAAALGEELGGGGGLVMAVPIDEKDSFTDLRLVEKRLPDVENAGAVGAGQGQGLGTDPVAIMTMSGLCSSTKSAVTS